MTNKGQDVFENVKHTKNAFAYTVSMPAFWPLLVIKAFADM